MGHTGRYRATLSLGGHYRVLGLYDTPEAAAQARDSAIIRLGLQDIAQLNNPKSGVLPQRLTAQERTARQ